MEDSFRVRVSRTFDSLSSSSSTPSQSSSSSQPLSSSLWSLTDEELEKKSWNREAASAVNGDVEPNDSDDDDEGPFPCSVDRLLLAMKGKVVPDDENPNPNPNPNPNGNGDPSTVSEDERKKLEDDLRELDDDDDEEEEDDDDDEEIGTSGGGPEQVASSSSSGAQEAAGDEEDVLDVKKSIGMDCTLDFEEEEDEHDKLAVGSEKTGDRLYMSDVTDYVPDYHSYDEIPVTFKEASRDPRANHLAAKLRLKEDAETARSFNSLQVSEPTETVVSGTENNTSEEGNNLKSILKRKEHPMGSKSEKRVRFEPSCKSNDEEESEGDVNFSSGASNGENTLHKQAPSQNQDSSLVPDHVRNPGRYTHYTFDSSSDMNEECNRQAYADFLNMLRKSKQSDPDEVPADLSKPVIFNPKKRAGQGLMPMTMDENDQTKEATIEESMLKKSLPVSFASGDAQEDEACEMEVDEQVNVAVKVSGQRTARKYRSKQSLETNETDS